MSLSVGNSYFNQDNNNNCSLDHGSCIASEDEISTGTSFPGTSTVVQIVIMSLSFSVGLLGNIVTIIIMSSSVKVYVLSRYIVSHAVADILLLMTVPFDAISHFQGSWNLGSFLCQARCAVFVVSPFVNSVMLVGMCFNSYIELCRSGPHIKLRSAVFKIVSVLAWFFFLMFGISIMLQSEIVKEIQSDRIHCISPLLMQDSTSGQVFRILSISLVLFIPLVICWVFITLTILYKEGFVTYSTQEMAAGALQAETRLKLFLLATSVAFTMCQSFYWLPYLALEITNNLNAVVSLMEVCHLTMSLPFINSAINPFLYIFFLKDAQQMFGNMKQRFTRDPPMIPLIPLN